MRRTFNIYCDESCHLEHDHQKAMVIGATWCPAETVKKISTSLRGIKTRHGLSQDFEIRWGKISPAKIDFYLEVLDYCFESTDLHFRAVVVPNKEKLDHSLIREHILAISDYLSENLTSIRPEEADGAKFLAELIRNQRLG